LGGIIQPYWGKIGKERGRRLERNEKIETKNIVCRLNGVGVELAKGEI
jgi:hypothetical protein